jgi:DNA polymerase III subunit epsilon
VAGLIAIGKFLAARRARRALPEALRDRHARMAGALAASGAVRAALALPLARARLVALDLETTGPDPYKDRIVSIGMLRVDGTRVLLGSAFSRVLRQTVPSANANVLIHGISGQEQLAALEPCAALLDALEYLGPDPALAFRADFDAPVFTRELRERLGLRHRTRFIDAARLLAGLNPGTGNDTLEDWLAHFGLAPLARHSAESDAYAVAELYLVLQKTAARAGITTLAELAELDRAQHWLGRRR